MSTIWIQFDFIIRKSKRAHIWICRYVEYIYIYSSDGVNRQCSKRKWNNNIIKIRLIRVLNTYDFPLEFLHFIRSIFPSTFINIEFLELSHLDTTFIFIERNFSYHIAYIQFFPSFFWQQNLFHIAHTVETVRITVYLNWEKKFLFFVKKKNSSLRAYNNNPTFVFFFAINSAVLTIIYSNSRRLYLLSLFHFSIVIM